MDATAKQFLIKLLETPSPSGYERPIQDVVRNYASDFADEISTDLHGNVIACGNPAGAVRVFCSPAIAIKSGCWSPKLTTEVLSTPRRSVVGIRSN